MKASVAFAADSSHAESIGSALLAQADELGCMADEVAKARTVLEYQGDRRKMALGIAFREAKSAGAGSATEAEHYARASSRYIATIAEMEADTLMAERVIQKHRAAESKFEALRSLLSLEKSKINML